MAARVRAPAAAQTGSLSTASAADLAASQRTFDSQCAWCHGAGGMGPDLRRTTLLVALDAALVLIVRGGIPGTDMPGFAVALTERASWQTAAYVRSLGRTPAQPTPGDARRGAALFDSAGCASCHVVNGRGGVLGPELTSIGARRGASARIDRRPRGIASAGLSRGPRDHKRGRRGAGHSRERGRVLDPRT